MKEDLLEESVMKNNKSNIQQKEKLISDERVSDCSTRELLNFIDSIKINLNVLWNSFEDIRVLINKFEFVQEQLNQCSNRNAAEIIQKFENYKEKTEIDSIFTDANQAVRDSIYSLNELAKLVNSSEMVSNVELN